MKRNFLKATLVVALAAVAGYGIYTAQSSQTELSDTALANVEALARAEADKYCHTNSDYTAICNYYDRGAICPCGF